MLFAHIADTHLGYRQFNLEEREQDFYRAFHEAVDRMITEGVDVVIHAGDLFDEPRPPIRALVEAKKGIERLREKGVRVVMIPGNHDLLMRRGSMAPHAIFDSVTVLTMDNPSIVVDDVFIGGVPYLSKSYRDILLERIRDLEKEASTYKQSILVLHQGIDKYLPYEHELSVGELPGGFGYYALGHVHSRIEEETNGGVLCYPGSTEMWRVDEIRDWEKKGKGFLLFDSGDMTPRRISLEGIRPFLKSEVTSEEDIQALKSDLERFVDEKPVLSLTIQSKGEFNYLYDRLKEELSEKALYLAIKKRLLLREETISKSGALDLKELIFEAAGGLDEDEKTFAFDIFKELSKNDIEGAVGLTEDFYERWKRGG